MAVPPPSGADGSQESQWFQSPSGEAWTELEQAQLRQEKLLSWHNAVIRDKILLKASRSTRDFHNILGVKRELRMENQQWHKNTK